MPMLRGHLRRGIQKLAERLGEPLQILSLSFAMQAILKNNRVVFNIGGNKYRLVVAVDYQRQTLFVRFVGTHRQYDAINVEVV